MAPPGAFVEHNRDAVNQCRGMLMLMCLETKKPTTEMTPPIILQNDSFTMKGTSPKKKNLVIAVTPCHACENEPS